MDADGFHRSAHLIINRMATPEEIAAFQADPYSFSGSMDDIRQARRIIREDDQARLNTIRASAAAGSATWQDPIEDARWLLGYIARHPA